jgi:hypothetical protein
LRKYSCDITVGVFRSIEKILLVREKMGAGSTAIGEGEDGSRVVGRRFVAGLMAEASYLT